jgi:hypothetical protein
MTTANRRVFLEQAAWAGTSLWLAGTISSAGRAAEGLTGAEFKKLHEELQPPRDELWRSVPWKMSLIEASRLGAKEKKLLVMRVRSGHPLGCV